MMGIARHGIWLAGVAAMGITGHATAIAAPATTRDLHMLPGPLATSLLAVGKATDTEIQFRPEDVAGAKAPALNGEYSAEDAVRALTAATSLKIEIKDGSIFVRGRLESDAAIGRQSGNEAIIVTGSRIRGAPVTSFVLTIDQSRMIDEGYTSLPTALKSVPENFGGGHNPGIGLGTTGSFDDSGASTINLRGLGADATLTLLNGHRLPTNSDYQTVDISTIPFGAIDRIEIIPDGASALYGSDAVAGVANIILKPDFDGLSTSARVGTSSDGGDNQHQFDVTSGHRWGSGGLIVSYDHEDDSPILGADREYTSTSSPGLYLTPALRHDSALISAHQDVGSHVSLSVDGLYNTRQTRLDYSLDPHGSVLASGGSVRSHDTSYSIAPSVTVRLPSQWRLSLNGVYGEDCDHYTSLNYYSGASIYPFYAAYSNKTEIVEAHADGPLLDIGAGDIRVAVGGGYRRNGYQETQDNVFAIKTHQSDYYAFGELSAPIVSPDYGIPLIRSASLNAAARYERYPNIASVVSPKVGAIISPTRDFDLKTSWGKSFKVPTFDQRFGNTTVTVAPASAYGGAGLPDSATILLLRGSNPNLKPERATTWTIGTSFHPVAIPRLHLDLTYFHVNYRHRVVAPITFLAQALSNPIYADLSNDAPSLDQIAGALGLGEISNVVGGPINQADVTAIVDDRYLNAANQRVKGLDGAISYDIPIGRAQSLRILGNFSYLESHQKLSDLQPAVALAGSIFNPPHFRAYGGATWTAKPISLSAFVTYTGPLKDVRAPENQSIGSMTTIDLSLRYDAPRGHGVTSGWAILFSVQNILNLKPPLISNTQIYEQPYDAANFSPVGRLLSVRIAKSW